MILNLKTSKLSDNKKKDLYFIICVFTFFWKKPKEKKANNKRICSNKLKR